MWNFVAAIVVIPECTTLVTWSWNQSCCLLSCATQGISCAQRAQSNIHAPHHFSSISHLMVCQCGGTLTAVINDDGNVVISENQQLRDTEMKKKKPSVKQQEDIKTSNVGCSNVSPVPEVAHHSTVTYFLPSEVDSMWIPKFLKNKGAFVKKALRNGTKNHNIHD